MCVSCVYEVCMKCVESVFNGRATGVQRVCRAPGVMCVCVWCVQWVFNGCAGHCVRCVRAMGVQRLCKGGAMGAEFGVCAMAVQ